MRAIAEVGCEKIHNTKIRHSISNWTCKFVRSYLLTEQIPRLKFSFDFLWSDLCLDDHDTETITAYQHTVGHLNMIDEKPVSRDILRFPAPVPRRFVTLLAAEDPRTMTIVGYFFMLLGRFYGLWCMGRQAAVMPI
jgi:hypothetical protein